MDRVEIEIRTPDQWRLAASVNFYAPEKGVNGATSVYYDEAFFAEFGAEKLLKDRPEIGLAALSVRLPLTLDSYQFSTWPSFLVDLLPQGEARRQLARRMERDQDDPGIELELLKRAAAAPVGNLRVAQAVPGKIQEAMFNAAGETSSVDAPLVDHRVVSHRAVTEDEIFARTDRFRDIAETYAFVAPGSSGIQGEWPKILLTRRPDGTWLPDSLVPDRLATDHAIYKLRKEATESDGLILASERPYQDVARQFGLRVGRPMHFDNDILKMPRFDREIVDGRVLYYGQESLVAAAGRIRTGDNDTHEIYLEVIRNCCTDPKTEIIEWVRRDVLNLAMGNPDNHGRNSALQKIPTGKGDSVIRLAPLYDFTPMIIDPRVIPRVTRWGCLNRDDSNPDWNVVCTTAAGKTFDPKELKHRLRQDAAFVAQLPEIAAKAGVPHKVIGQALRRHDEIAAGLAKLEA